MAEQKELSQSILLLGASRTGKTYITNKYAQFLARPIFYLDNNIKELGDSVSDKYTDMYNLSSDEDNVQINPYLESQYGTKCKKDPYKVSYESALKLENSTIIIDDIIAVKKSELTDIKKLLDFSKHHSNNNIIAIVHRLQISGFYTLLSSFDALIVPTFGSNINMASQLLSYFKILKHERQEWLEKFSQHEKKNEYGFLRILTKGRVVSLHVGVEEFFPGAKRFEPLDIKGLLKVMPDGADESDLSLYELLASELPANTISPTHTVSLMAKKGEIIKVSLIDYIYYLRWTNDRPPQNIEKLHKIIVSKYSIPHCFIKNKHMKP
jgi:hypothetical protein